MKETRPRWYTAEQVFIPCAPSNAWHQEQQDSSYVKCSEDVCLYTVHLCTSKLPDPQGTHPTDQWCQLSIPFYNGGSFESQHGYNSPFLLPTHHQLNCRVPPSHFCLLGLEGTQQNSYFEMMCSMGNNYKSSGGLLAPMFS